MPKLDLKLLVDAGAEEAQKPSKRVQFRMAFREAEAFNNAFKDHYTEAEESSQIRRLDTLMELAAVWLTTKPLKQEGQVSQQKAQKNAARWMALAQLCEQCSTELISMGFRPLFGHWKGDPLEVSADSHANYWLERLDPKHRGASALKDRYAMWSTSVSDKSFFDYVDADPSAKSVPQVRYDKGVEDSKADEARKRRRASQLSVQNGQLWRMDEIGNSTEAYDTNKNDLKTEFAGPGFAIFVWDIKKRIYSGKHIANSLHHSTARGGRPVRCAGELSTNIQGKIVMITSKTGHYTTGPSEFRKFLENLKILGVMDNSAFCVPDTSGQTPGSWQVYAAQEWLTGGRPKSRNDVLAVLPNLNSELRSRNFWNRLSP